mgnify:CR=1 FL=1
MTEMTKKMESRTWEELPEVYRLAVILVICVIGGEVAEHEYWIYNSVDSFVAFDQACSP